MTTSIFMIFDIFPNMLKWNYFYPTFNIFLPLMFLQQALTKVPTNVQHFADLGVYKHLKKKTHLTKEVLFPHLPAHVDGSDPRKVS